MKKHICLCTALAIALWGQASAQDAKPAPPVAKDDPAAKLITPERMKTHAKTMYVYAYADAVDENLVGFIPDASTYKTATDFIRTFTGQQAHPNGKFANKVLRATPIAATPRVFACVDSIPTDDWKAFGPKNHGWCFVPEFGEYSDAGTPFAFSDNLLNKTFGGEVQLRKDSALGTKVVVAYHGGGAAILDASAKDFWQKFNPAEAILKGKPFLRP